MALATKCPQCGALFRVVADQLKLRGGLVRCGQCRAVFDAIGSLTYVEDSAVAPLRPAKEEAPAAGPSPTPRTEEATPAARHALGRSTTLRIFPVPPATLAGNRLPYPAWVLTRQEVFDGIHEAAAASSTFRYQRAAYDADDAEFRGFGGQNFQHLTRTLSDVRTYYDGQGSGSEVNAIVKSKYTEDWHTTETVVGTDIRAIAAYEVTRDIKLEAGLQFLGIFTGVGRGPFIDMNSEAVTMVGTTFGFTINR
mgnify:CR=1 FL=1